MQKNPTFATNIHPFPIPQPEPNPTARGETSTPPAAPPAPEPAPRGGAKRGRPPLIAPAPKVLEMLCAAIRRRGISDSAAAVQVGVSTTTLSRWKKAFPELALQLLQAREDCRNRHLDNIQKHADGDDPRGWRASAWILERLFPGDYSPRMRERFTHSDLEDFRRGREERAVLNEDIEYLHAEQDAAREEREMEQAKAAARAESAEDYSKGDSHYSQKIDEAAPVSAHEADQVPPGAHRSVGARADNVRAAAPSATGVVSQTPGGPCPGPCPPSAPTERCAPRATLPTQELCATTRTEDAHIYSEGDSHDSRKMAAPEELSVPPEIR